MNKMKYHVTFWYKKKFKLHERYCANDISCIGYINYLVTNCNKDWDMNSDKSKTIIEIRVYVNEII